MNAQCDSLFVLLNNHTTRTTSSGHERHLGAHREKGDGEARGSRETQSYITPMNMLMSSSGESFTAVRAIIARAYNDRERARQNIIIIIKLEQGDEEEDGPARERQQSV